MTAYPRQFDRPIHVKMTGFQGVPGRAVILRGLPPVCSYIRTFSLNKGTGMAQRRKSMQTIRILLNMKHNGLSDQQVADALKIAKGSVNAFHNRYKSTVTVR